MASTIFILPRGILGLTTRGYKLWVCRCHDYFGDREIFLLLYERYEKTHILIDVTFGKAKRARTTCIRTFKRNAPGMETKDCWVTSPRGGSTS